MKPEKKIFYIGQQFKVIEDTRDGRTTPKVKAVKILKLYKGFALCRVNARYNECFTYDVLAAAVEV